MIIANIIGGLGNQIFQYANARAWSLRLGTELRLDLSDFRAYPLRKFELSKFNIDVQQTSFVDRLALRQDFRGARQLRRLLGYRFVREESFQFHELDLHAHKKSVLYGYWQSFRYFTDFRREILEDLQLREALPLRAAALAADVRAQNTVSLHVRRGDYANNPITLKHHGLCSLEYYADAVALIRTKIPNPSFLIFSDDLEWCRSNLNIFAAEDEVRFADVASPETPEIDLHLMSLCKGHVIANSSLSWWGAWIASSPMCPPVAPREWFNDPSVSTLDLCPPDWIRISRLAKI